MKVYCLMSYEYEDFNLVSVHSTWAQAYDAAKTVPLCGAYNIYIHNVDGGACRAPFWIGYRDYACDFEYHADYSRDVDPSEATP